MLDASPPLRCASPTKSSMDSDEYYNLWAAFMEPDSPPSSPSYCDSASPVHGEEDDDNLRDNGEGLRLEKEQGEEADGEEKSFRFLFVFC